MIHRKSTIVGCEKGSFATISICGKIKNLKIEEERKNILFLTKPYFQMSLNRDDLQESLFRRVYRFVHDKEKMSASERTKFEEDLKCDILLQRELDLQQSYSDESEKAESMALGKLRSGDSSPSETPQESEDMAKFLSILDIVDLFED